MQIEFPSPQAVTTYGARHYPTIGAFYEAIAEVIADRKIPIVGTRQLAGGEGLDLIKVTYFGSVHAELVRSEVDDLESDSDLPTPVFHPNATAVEVAGGVLFQSSITGLTAAASGAVGERDRIRIAH